MFVIERSKSTWATSEFYNHVLERWNVIRHPRLLLTVNTIANYLDGGLEVTTTLLGIYTVFISPIAVLVLAAFAEWNLWTDEKEETFKHVDQWGALVAAGLVFAASLVDRFGSKVKKLKKWMVWKFYLKRVILWLIMMKVTILQPLWRYNS
jgi:hypothetical protein